MSVMERPAAKQTWTDQYSFNQDKFTGGERWEEKIVQQLVKLNIVCPMALILVINLISAVTLLWGLWHLQYVKISFLCMG